MSKLDVLSLLQAAIGWLSIEDLMTLSPLSRSSIENSLRALNKDNLIQGQYILEERLVNKIGCDDKMNIKYRIKIWRIKHEIPERIRDADQKGQV